MNGYNFTERVRKVLALARKDAQERHHEYVGTEHVLLGMLREGEGVGCAVLTNLGVDAVGLKTFIEAHIKPGDPAHESATDLPYTSRAKKVIEFAMAEARDLKHSYVGTEHLLLGLMREESGIAAQALGAAGVTLDTARPEMVRLLGTEPPPKSAASPVEMIDTISLEIRYAGGAVERHEFRSAERAASFLQHAARRTRGPA